MRFLVGILCWQRDNGLVLAASYIRMQQHSRATLLPFFKKIQVLLFLYSREEKEGVVHRAVSGDSRTETEKSRRHETFLFSLKKTNNGENVALSKFESSCEYMRKGLIKKSSSRKWV